MVSGRWDACCGPAAVGYASNSLGSTARVDAAENRAVHRSKTWWRHRSLFGGPVSTTVRPGPLRQSFGGVALQLDPTFLSRLQWAWVIGWHILLPAFTVGLASFIAVLEGLHSFAGKESWLRISNFWMRIFAVSFGMGVVTASSCRSDSVPTGPGFRISRGTSSRR